MKTTTRLTMRKLRKACVELDRDLKRFGREKCKWNRRRFKTPKKHLDCGHPAMDFGGMTRNTKCELENCPRALYGDEKDGTTGFFKDLPGRKRQRKARKEKGE